MTRTTRPRSLLIGLAVTATIAGCTSSGGTLQVPLDAPIFVTATGDTIRMHEELRIGRLDGPDEYTFSFITWTLPTENGGVILYDLESSDGSGERGRIRQFDESGRFIRYIGGPGAGPGEYSSGPDGTVLRDGTLLIVDQSLARITQFDVEGNLLATWPGHPAMASCIKGSAWFLQLGGLTDAEGPWGS